MNKKERDREKWEKGDGSHENQRKEVRENKGKEKVAMEKQRNEEYKEERTN